MAASLLRVFLLVLLTSLALSLHTGNYHNGHDHNDHDHNDHDHGSHEHGSHEHGSHEHGSHEHGSHEHGSHEHGGHGHGSHEHGSHEHGSHEHGGHGHGSHEHEGHEHAAHHLPFLVKMYEGTYKPAGEDGSEAQVALTIHYEARHPYQVRWTVLNSDIGLSLTDISGDRVWSHCSKADHHSYVCSSTMQTSIVRALRVVGAEILHASNRSGVMRYHGFARAAKNFHGVGGPAHQVALAAPFRVYDHPFRKNHFTVGTDVVLRWAFESDNEHELHHIKRKHGAAFTEQELFNDDSEDEHHHHDDTVNVDNVGVHVTVTHVAEHHYDYVVEVTVHEPTSEDTGVYVLVTREGLEHWVELLPQMEESAYPAAPIIHLIRKSMGPYIGVVCTAEGHALTDISLSFNGEHLEATPDEPVSTASRTEDALAIAYKGAPSDERPYEDYSGTYECEVTSADGTRTAIHEDFTFTAPARN